MMKRFVSLVLILCLFSCTALAADGDLPDIEAFSNGLLENRHRHSATKSFIEEEYNCTKEDAEFVWRQYYSLLKQKYDMEEMGIFICDEEKFSYIFTALKSTKIALEHGVDGMFGSDIEKGLEASTDFVGEIRGAHVVIECVTRYDRHEKTNEYNESFIRIRYRTEFNYIDTGDRIDLSERPTVAPTATPTAAPTATPEKCPICNGTGKCPKCGGDMWVTGFVWEYVNGSPVSVLKTRLCDGRYCGGGACDKCGGDGWLDD